MDPLSKPRISPVRCVEARHVTSYADFRGLLGDLDEPLLLKGPPIANRIKEFNLETFAAELGHERLPGKALVHRSKRATPKGSEFELPPAQGCSLVIAHQCDGSVMGAEPAPWERPQDCTIGNVINAILGGSGPYVTTRSEKKACWRVGDSVQYNGQASEDRKGFLVRELTPRVPMPLLLPEDEAFQIVFWMGHKGHNFGLHTDLFAEQFLVQHQGVKEVFLMLPENAAEIAPFPFLSSPHWYKSELRSVDNSAMRTKECQRTELSPGDVLYIPPWWWHEVRTISSGPSLSTTYRFHTEDAEHFGKVMNALYFLHKHMQDGCKIRLAKHFRSFLAYGLAKADSEVNTLQGPSSARQVSIPIAVVGALFVGLLGFVAGRSSRACK